MPPSFAGMAKKRAHILPRPDAARTSAREAVVIAGTCRIGDRAAEDVLVLDLDSRGCRLRGGSLGVSKSEPVELQIGAIGPVAARLKWVKSGLLGVAFAAPLTEEDLQRLYDTPAPPPNVIPMRRSAAT